MSVNLERLARQHPYMEDVYTDLADRVAKLGGPVQIQKTQLRAFPSVREIGQQLVTEGFREAGVFLLNAAKRLTNDERPLILSQIRKGDKRPSYLVSFEGDELHLTQRELELLDYFSFRADTVVTSAEIFEALGASSKVWVNVNILKLRRKIEKDPESPTRLVSVGHGSGTHGYIFNTNIR